MASAAFKPRADHGHHGVDTVTTTRLFWTMALNFLITLAEGGGGVLSGSLSLLSDALHNFSDGIAIIVSSIAISLSARPTPTVTPSA